MDISEKNLEATIEAVLLHAGPDADQAAPGLVSEELPDYAGSTALISAAVTGKIDVRGRVEQEFM